MPVLAPAHIGVEILDSPSADPALVRHMLGDIARANRWFGGVRAMKAGLHALLPHDGSPHHVTLLDVGTGGGDLPLAAHAWGRAHSVDIRGVGVERHRAAARLSHDNGVPCVVACGSALPFRTRTDGTRDTELGTPVDGITTRSTSPVPRHVIDTELGTPVDGITTRSTSPVPRHVIDTELGTPVDGITTRSTSRVPRHVHVSRHVIDVVLISQLLHHFDDDAAVALIAAAATVARRGVILADLRPALGAATAFRIAGRVLGFHPSTVTDGVVSVARGRSAAALAALARRAGPFSPIARNLPMARVMVAFRTDS